jgi:hypothetical protein
MSVADRIFAETMAVLYGLFRRSTIQWEEVVLGIVMLLCVAFFGVTTWLYRGKLRQARWTEGVHRPVTGLTDPRHPWARTKD